MYKVYEKGKKRKCELSPKKQRMQMLIFTFTFTKVRDEAAIHTLVYNVGFDHF